MVTFKFDKAHGTAKKGEEREMFETTAEALVIHNIGKITKRDKKPAPKKPGKAGPITGK